MDFIVLAIRILIILNGSFVKNSPYSHQRFLSAEAFSYSSRNTLPDNKGHRPRDELEEPKDHSWMLLPDDEDDKSSAQGLRRVHKSVPDDLLPTVPAAASGHGDGGHVYHACMMDAECEQIQQEAQKCVRPVCVCRRGWEPLPNSNQCGRLDVTKFTHNKRGLHCENYCHGGVNDVSCAENQCLCKNNEHKYHDHDRVCRRRKLMCYECEGPYTIDSTKYDRFPTLPCHLSQGVRRYCDKYGCLFTVNPTTGRILSRSCGANPRFEDVESTTLSPNASSVCQLDVIRKIIVCRCFTDFCNGILATLPFS